MKATIYRSEHASAALTDESTQSSYGIPVLRMTLKNGDAEDYGPRAALPSGAALAERFIRSSPPAPRSLADVLHVGATFPSSWLSDDANRALADEEPER